MSILEKLKASNSKLLKAESKDLQKWSLLNHNKVDLELFLNLNIAEINYKTKDNKNANIICTSNLILIKIYSKLKDKNQKIKIANNINVSAGIRTNDLKSVTSWDLVENKFKIINIENDWQIINFISITPENVLILDELLKQFLK